MKPIRPQVIAIIGAVVGVTVAGLFYDEDIEDIVLVVSILANIALAIIALDRQRDDEEGG